MPFLTDRNDMLAEGISGCRLDELLADGRSTDVLLALLRELENEPSRPSRRNQNIEKSAYSPEGREALQKVAHGPWRSLGGYFDYTDWQERDRFKELDRTIAESRHPTDADDEPEDFLRTAA